MVILVDIRNQAVYRQGSSRLFLLLIELCILNTGLEAVSWLIRGQVTQQINFIFNTVYFMITPVPQLVWSLYVERQFAGEKNELPKLLRKLCLPVAVAEIALLINCFHPFVFDVDPGGHYYRLWGYPPLMAVCYSLFIYTLGRVVYGRHQLAPKLFWSLMVFHLPPLLGGILQCILYGTSFIWPGAALGLLIGYINIQNKRLVTDYLTGAYNRLEMDRYIRQKISNAEALPFGGILIDIDNFKEINDTCGHVVGDEIIIKTVDILQSSITPQDFLARYGGDEFLIILNDEAKNNITRTIERIEKSVANFNKNSNYPFKLSVSMGYDVYDTNQVMDVTDFLKHIDNKMYNTKKTK